MKKLILSMMLAAFAVAVQAGNDQGCTANAPCCGKAKATADAKGQCPMAAKQANATCPYAGNKAAKQTAAKPALQSPKALSLASK